MSDAHTMPTVRPGDLFFNEITGTCPGTLGRFEFESVLGTIVLYHREKGLEEWTPLSRWQIFEWLPTSKVMSRVTMNPFYKIDLPGFIEAGYIDGWDVRGEEGAHDMGTISKKLLDKLRLVRN